MPHANPIINDDTVAALTGASAWPKTTLTGSVDWRKNPPIARTTMNGQPDSSGAANRNGADSTQRPDDDPSRSEAIGRGSAEESSRAAREQVARRDRAGLR